MSHILMIYIVFAYNFLFPAHWSVHLFSCLHLIVNLSWLCGLFDRKKIELTHFVIWHCWSGKEIAKTVSNEINEWAFSPHLEFLWRLIYCRLSMIWSLVLTCHYSLPDSYFVVDKFISFWARQQGGWVVTWLFTGTTSSVSRARGGWRDVPCRWSIWTCLDWCIGSIGWGILAPANQIVEVRRSKVNTRSFPGMIACTSLWMPG
jgi:hypothetical protein